MAMLRPESEMKDSGIEWVGKIPKELDYAKDKVRVHNIIRCNA